MNITRHPSSLPRLAAALALCAATWALAQTQTQTQTQVIITEPWARATVAQQKATGFFAQITHPKGGKLIGATSPVAGVVEIHEMAMDGDVMKMRAINALELPAGKPVALRPGGHHVMLLDLKQQLKPGDTVPLTLVFEGADKKRQNVEVKAAVKALATP